jgi:hypothetical protein
LKLGLKHEEEEGKLLESKKDVVDIDVVGC